MKKTPRRPRVPAPPGEFEAEQGLALPRTRGDEQHVARGELAQDGFGRAGFGVFGKVAPGSETLRAGDPVERGVEAIPSSRAMRFAWRFSW